MNARRPWSAADDAAIRALYPNTATKVLAAKFGRALTATHQHAYDLGLKKSPEFLASLSSGRLQDGRVGAATRFAPGNVPWNKGTSYQAGGRSAETRFKPGSRSIRWDPDIYAVGALRMNADGYVDMKVREGLRAWDRFHRILWEDAHGPIPRGMCLVFRDGDRLNLELENLELVTRGEIMRRNTIHNLPEPLASTIRTLGQLKKRIRREDQGRRPAQSPIRDAGSTTGRGQADGS